MKTKSIHIGITPLQNTPKSVQGDIVSLGEEKYYKISNVDQMPPLFANIVSDSDLWMFISSNGALTAGRRNPDNALFPYYTDDRIHDSAEITGSKTIILVEKDGKSFLWEPFSLRYNGIYDCERNIYKNIIGNKLVFEEINLDLQIRFRYAWLNCDAFGFVRKSQIANLRRKSVNISILDGIQNILPAEVERKFQLEYSTLLDGYKKNELLKDTALALYSLSSVPTDKAEPSESLKANTVWSAGMENARILLSARQLDAFRSGLPVQQEADVRAARGAYFLQSEMTLAAGAENAWYIVADLNKTHRDVENLNRFLRAEKNIEQRIEAAILTDSEQLIAKIAQADGCQTASDDLNIFRHFSNTLYNIMRGGIFDNGYIIEKNDLRAFIETANRNVAKKHASAIAQLPEQLNITDFNQFLSTADSDLESVCVQYLPLKFGRRHGDPSRPWNQFSIEFKDDAGNKKLDYQGNWRDIFQNWEALALSYPEYIERMIARFLSATTADGYNPYRVVRDGFDWEVIDPDDAWSHIGYWGDHQIIYLLKLLELSHKYHPGTLQALLDKPVFTYANVPYKIKSYQEILQNPHETIDFDFDLNKSIDERVTAIGTDGKYVFLENGEIYRVNLMEKLLVPVLVKCANFIPGAGIWMNTQRPEWNDANNALVGYGTSMVTLYYMRRFFDFAITFFENAATGSHDISSEVFAFFTRIHNGFADFKHLLNGEISDEQRKQFLDCVGQAGSDYRLNFYKNGFSGERQMLQTRDVISFLKLGKQYIDHSIESNQRNDDLFHAYNLIDLKHKNAISIRRLYEMLEGQVAVLSSGYLSVAASISLLHSLRNSALYRADQASYLLYPNRRLPRFTEKNVIPPDLLKNAGLAEKSYLTGSSKIFTTDDAGNWHFASQFRNARLLKEALVALQKTSPEITAAEIDSILNIYETIFDHQSFTGRSGTFYKYEGLGSIYWHMVSKLLLAVQDTFYRAVEAKAHPSVLEKLSSHYYDIREGIGIHKNPEVYGAFTTDAYSHTPENSGAQQPGMTGQVKEDILSRFGEFGVVVRDSKITFIPALLKKGEFLKASKIFDYYDVNNKKQSLTLNQGMLAFTICQVPVIFILAKENTVFVTMKDGSAIEMDGMEIETALSQSIFQRDDTVRVVRVSIDV